MRIKLAAILLLTYTISFSQSIQELEYELSYYKSGETWGNKKGLAFKLLELDGLNTKAINYLVEVYGRNNQKDSIDLLFEKLVRNNPRRPEPYLIRARDHNAEFAGLTVTQQINFLKEAYKIDSINTETNYKLGKLYYELFIKEYHKNDKTAKLDYFSTNSIRYFSFLFNLNTNFKETLKYPLLQLSNYLEDKSRAKLYESYNVQSSYFPVSAFINLPEDWETDYSVNVIEYTSGSDFNYSGTENAVFHINWYSKYLEAFEEPILNDSLPAKIYRFTWLRTFDFPIVIRIENMNDTVMLYWKVDDGAGGYELGKIIENKSKKLTLNEWKDFIGKVDSVNFWKLSSTGKGIFGIDGAQWILEGKEHGNYHVVDRWSGGEIEKVCMELIKLSDLKIEQKDIY